MNVFAYHLQKLKSALGNMNIVPYIKLVYELTLNLLNRGVEYGRANRYQTKLF